MRILLAQNSPYYPAHGGGDRSNRLLLEALAQRGHTCRVVARAQTNLGEAEHRHYLTELARRSVTDVSSDQGAVRFLLNGVSAHVVTSHPNLRAYFSQAVSAFEPEVILVSTDDPAQVFIETALQSTARVVYLARTTLSLPFGPESAIPSDEKTERLRQTDGVVAVSNYVASYVRRWSGIEARELPISLLDPGPYRRLGSINSEFVTMVNPCAVKGISIFLALAERLPHVMFAAVPTWGTTSDDLVSLTRYGNIRVLEAVDRIGYILSLTRVVLVPSLWAEARGRIIVEAMLHGIPVLASNIGGIPEAKLGVDYLLPVYPITRYQHRVDQQMVPVADVPPQNIDPWLAALKEVLSSRERYERIARESRTAALTYASGLSIAPFESYLEEVVTSPVKARRTSGSVALCDDPRASVFQKLSPEKLALLAARMKKKGADAAPGNAWFPTLRESSGVRLRLFCFPYAGGGASVFRTWPDKLAFQPQTRAAVAAHNEFKTGIQPPPIRHLSNLEVCPVRLPGRESRMSEPLFESIEPLVEALAGQMRHHLDVPYALFGHSMGAMIAFELARRFRAQGLAGPQKLLVASARAPQFRHGHVAPPEPSLEEFLAELRKLEAFDHLLENEELLKLVLPALRADAGLCRQYSYQPQPPLDCPIVAYVGADDPRLPRDAVQAWKEQTTGTFAMRVLPGGHFFLHTSERRFLEILAQDLFSGSETNLQQKT